MTSRERDVRACKSWIAKGASRADLLEMGFVADVIEAALKGSKE